MPRYSTIILTSVGGATLVIVVILLSSAFAEPTKDYAIDIDPIKDKSEFI